MMKLNVGASPIWVAEKWHTLDHKVRKDDKYSLVGTASNIPLEKNTVSTIFCSHMFEHIPHVELEDVLLEFNRVLETGGILRILTPDLKKIATAYINNDLDLDENLVSAIITPDYEIVDNANKTKPAFIVFNNYELILKWNRSLRFGLAVCTLKNKFENEI